MNVAPKKTTIDFPGELLHRAKIVAAQRRTTLRELVVKGLETVTSDIGDEEKDAFLNRQSIDAPAPGTAGMCRGRWWG